MILQANSDFALEHAAAKDAAAKKAAAAAQAAIAAEKSRIATADALQKSVERETQIEAIPALVARVTALENRARSSVEILDAKIVACDSPIHWIKRNWLTVASLILTTVALTSLMIHFLGR